MEKFVFSDGESVCISKDGKIEKFESEYIKNYRERIYNMSKSKEWKYSGEGARFREDNYLGDNIEVKSFVNSVNATETDDKIIYTFVANEASGVIEKSVYEKKDGERFIIHINDGEFVSSDFNVTDKKLVAELRRNFVSSDLVLLDVKKGDFVSITDGESKDENPSFSKTRAGVIYYNSYATGRDSHGEFVEYAPSVIYEYNINNLELKEIKADNKYSYIKPIEDKNGDIYCIKKPAKEKEKRNVFLEILLIPYHIIMAIVNFIQLFAVIFNGKTLTGKGDNPAKGRKTDSRKMVIKGNIIEVDKEIEKNKKFKDKDLSFIPHSWKLVKICGNQEIEIKSGICDFCLTENAVICTNGKKIFRIKEDKCEKVYEGDLILNVASVTCASESSLPKNTDLFDF